MPRTVTHRRLEHRRSPEQAWSAARAHADGETGYAIDGPNGSLTIWLRLMPYAPRRLALPRQPCRGSHWGAWKPDAAACGADMAPISNAVRPAQRRAARHPRAVCTLSAAAASPPRLTPRPAPDAGLHHGEAAPGQVQYGRCEQHDGDQAPAGPDVRRGGGHPLTFAGGGSDSWPGCCPSARDRVALLQLLA